MRNPNKNYDVIVVGAGAAGCLFSRNLAQAGYSVCLVEKKDRNKLSHDWWDFVDKSIFDKVNIAYPKEDELWKLGEVTVYSPLNLLQVKVEPFTDYVNLDRRKFNIRLLTEAINDGIEFFDNTTVEGPIIEDETDSIVGIRIKDLDPIRGRLIVDCSGYEGIIRSNIPFNTDFDKKIRREDTMLTYREMRGKKPSKSYPDSIIIAGKHTGVSSDIFFQDEYVEFFGGHADIPSIRVTPKEMAYELIEKYKDICGTKIVMGGYKTPIPFRRALDSFVANGLMMIGDAACQVSPRTGEGIAPSLNAAMIGSNVAIRAFEKESITKEDLWQYNVDYHRLKFNQDASSTDIGTKIVFTLSEEEMEYVLTNDIIDIRNYWKPAEEVDKLTVEISKKEKYRPKISVRSKILAHLATLADLPRKEQEMQKLCREYPEEYNPEIFNAWREKINNCYIVRYDLDKTPESELIVS
jgi:flavin-dependent dehydrogenase